MNLSKKLNPTLTGREAKTLEEGLRKLVISQEAGLAAILNVYQMYLSGLTAGGRPIGSFLFLGPTGTGKTRIVEALAEMLVRNPRAVIKIDCAEFQHSHEIAKLIGSPPGYLGHRETHPLLSQEVLNQHHTDTVKVSFVLFDEIEKASDSLWNLLLGILDKATLTLGDNRRVDFSRAMIFMTSNLGAENMGAKPKIGFQDAFKDDLIALKAKVHNIGIEAAKRKFKPEFMNRIDKTCVFSPLDQAAIRLILDNELDFVQQRVFNSGTTFVFKLSDNAKQLVISKGYSLEYNARHLKRALERLLVQPLANLIATGQIKAGDFIDVMCEEGGDNLDFYKTRENLSASALAQMV